MSKLVLVKIDGQNASGRTRTRVKQNGPEFELIEPNNSKSVRSNQSLLKSTRTNWLGWLPNDEIKITNLTKDWNDYGNNNPW